MIDQTAMTACLNILSGSDDQHITHNDLVVLGFNFDKSKSHMNKHYRREAIVYLVSQFQLLDSRITNLKTQFDSHSHNNFGRNP